MDIASDPLLGLENLGRRLILANASLDSTATYVCRASNPAGRTEFSLVAVEDLYPVNEGGRILSIQLADVTDSGRYVCMAENVAGEKEKTFDLSVLGMYEELQDLDSYLSPIS